MDLLPIDTPFEPFALPVSDEPHVTIVIPVYGKLRYTLACLRSIARHGAAAPFEVVVVDDASPDDSAATLAQIHGLQLVRNAKNLGFVGSCNAGAAAARGAFLLFLNNDTQVTAGWLDALLACFEERPDCGIAGSRLIYPDGRLQEAGALVFADGSAWNVGRYSASDCSLARFRRRVDYVSGASLLIRRDTFNAIGGFDVRYAPGYGEDVDLAFAARQLGLATYYEPTSIVVHCEGMTSGTDPEAGMKRYQRANQTKFAAKWAAALTRQPPPGTAIAKAIHWHRRGRVLIVDAVAPDPTRDSGSVRLAAILRILDEQGWDTAFYADDGHTTAADVVRLGALGCEALTAPEVRSLPDWLNRHGRELAAVMLCRYPVADQYAPLVRKHAPQAKLLFDTVDLHFLREQRAAKVAHSHTMQQHARKSRERELALVAAADTCFVVSPYEQALLAKLLPSAPVQLLSNILDSHGCGQPHAERTDLVFIGGYSHPPNADAMHWISSEILPAIRDVMPDIRIHLVGDLPDAKREALQAPGIVIHGRVVDLEPLLSRCLATIAPLRFGAGVKGKINLSMSHGVPVIATHLAAEGMRLVDGENVLIADSPNAIAAAVQRLAGDEPLWTRLSRASLDNVAQHFSAQAANTALERALRVGA